MKKTLIKLSKTLVLCSICLTSVVSVNQPVSIFAEEDKIESSEEENTQDKESIEMISYSEGLKSLSKEDQEYIESMKDKYSDYKYMCNMMDFEATDEMYKALEEADPSPESQNKAMYEFLGDRALKIDYDENKKYSKTHDGQEINEFLKDLLKEAIEDHQSDKVYMMDKIANVNYKNEATDMLDIFTYHYANQSNMLQFIISQYSASSIKVQERYYKDVSEEIGVEITKDTDLSELDKETVDAMYASEAFKKASDPKENPDLELSEKLASATNIEDWNESLENLYKIKFTNELSGKDLNMLSNAFNQLRVIRVKYYDIIGKVVDGVDIDSNVTPTEDGTENKTDTDDSESINAQLEEELTEESEESKESKESKESEESEKSEE